MNLSLRPLLAAAGPALALICAAALTATAPVRAEEGAGASQAAEPPARWETSHAIEVGGVTVEYDAVVTGLQLDNDDGAPAAQLWYTAYFRTNGAAHRGRPLVFSYNGGPGSASFWLHMGIMGPRRVVTPDVGPQGAPPYPLEDNAWTILDIADIVMVDPIGTGFSHTLGETPGSDYWGIDEDAKSLAQF
ncbi:MAG: peptidase S10, partial [Acidobacteriota bacterium]|nr:peptidase S10 [Acidobacteriota bacterium]